MACLKVNLQAGFPDPEFLLPPTSSSNLLNTLICVLRYPHSFEVLYSVIFILRPIFHEEIPNH